MVITFYCTAENCNTPLSPEWLDSITDPLAPLLCMDCAIAQGVGKDYDANTLRALMQFIQTEQTGPTGWAVTDLTTEINRFAELHGITL